MGTNEGSERETGGASSSVWKGLCAGALSGVASRFVVYPFDTLKSQLQLQGGLPHGATDAGNLRYSGLGDAVRKVAGTEGLRGFYRGFSTVLLGVVPANMAYFGGYELGKALVPSDSGILGTMAVGAVAQVTAGVVFNPIDIVKERMQVQVMMSSVYRYNGALDAVKALLAREGPAGLLKGYWITNSVWIPWNVLYISGYEASKQRVADGLYGGCPVEDLPAWAVSGCAAGSAAVAAIITAPADVIKVRLQVMAAAPGGSKLSAALLAREIWQREGVTGLFGGLSARVLSIAPGCAISWLLYENIKKRL